MVEAEVGENRSSTFAPPRILGKSGLKNGKLGSVGSVQPRQSQKPQPTSNTTSIIACPECGSSKLFKDGFRYLYDGTPVQRLLCRDCGYRFTVEKSRGQWEKPLQKTSKQSLNNGSGLYSNRQVCVALTRGAKNLAEVETRKQEKPTREGTTETADVKGKLVDFLWHLKKQGRADDTIRTRKYMLGTLVKFGANLFNPESVRDTIARYPKWNLRSKNIAVQCYSSFLEFLGLKWNPPKYRPAEKLPFIPLEKELDTLMHSSGKNLGAFLQGLKDTGADPGELAGLKWVDINIQSKTVSINRPVKGHNARILKVSDEFLRRINGLQKRNDGKVFNNARIMFRNLYQQRRRIAHEYGNPRLLEITFRTFRHWKGTMEYHKTHDAYHVKKILGHKRLQSTEIYINLEQAVFKEESDEFYVKAVKTLDEACKLIEVGFEYVTDMEGYKVFRKRK
jgi:integrase/DNA-directed RNA polymerase subunit RPC12/RpoP